MSLNGRPPRRIIVTPKAEREIRSLPPAEQARVRHALDELAGGSPSSDIRKLAGRQGEWRLRVGDYRVRYRLAPDLTIVVLSARHRRDAYRE